MQISKQAVTIFSLISGNAYVNYTSQLRDALQSGACKNVWKTSLDLSPVILPPFLPPIPPYQCWKF